MTSKLEYLKRYLTTPGERAPTSLARGQKERPKKAKKPSALPDTRIRDLSEVLPEAREQRKEVKQKTVRAHGRKLCVDEDTVFVDKDVVDEAEKRDDIEKSGVAWKIQQHRRPGGIALAVKQEAKGNVKEDLRHEKDADGDAGVSMQAMCGASAKSVKVDDRDQSLSRVRGVAHSAAVANHGDVSPPRRGAIAAKSAPARRRPRHDSDSDLSVPRKTSDSPVPNPERNARDSYLSPPRRAPAGAPISLKLERGDSDSDLSLPRKGASGHASGPWPPIVGGEGSLSPSGRPGGVGAAKFEVKRHRHDSDSDLSPPRKGAPNICVATAAGPPGRTRHSEFDLAPPQKAQDHSQSAASHGRKHRHDSDSDLTTPRKGVQEEEEQEAEEEKMSSGLKVGLVKGSELKKQAAQVREDRKAALAAAPDEETGRGAATVYRNKEGRQIEREEWVEQQQKPRKKRKSDYPEQELEWGGGLKQRVSQEEQDAEVARIAAQPFARYEPDEKYLEMLRERSDWNDPLRHHEKDEAASSVQSVSGSFEPPKPPPKPKCPHHPWSNRFDILPGYRWDGKVRGNDFERRWLEAKNGRELKKKEAYRWEQEMDQNS